MRHIPEHTCQRFCCPVCHHDLRTHRTACIDAATAPRPDRDATVTPLVHRCTFDKPGGTFCVRACRDCDKRIARRVANLAHELVDDRIGAARTRSNEQRVAA